jgi:5-formyltetrahydrofolate cyclo-ligase
MKKSELRDKYRKLRLQLSPGELERLSESIVEMALTHFQLAEKTISMYLPIERQQELNTYLLWERAKSVGATVAIPKSNFETLEMRHYLFEHTDQLEITAQGIPEPKKGKVIAADRFDIVFVPLLAVDVNGHRVGYGKGFYDRFLRKCAPGCQFVGLHYFDLEAPIDDVLPTDVRLNAVVTPNKVVRFD